MTNPVIRRTATVLALLASAVFAALAFADTGPPTASFEYSPSAPLSSQDITFTSTSSDPDGPLVSEDWDLDNDGQYDDASGSVAQTSFTSPGDHVVGLEVADGDGNVETTSQTVSVGNRQPTADFGMSPASPTTLQTITFNSQSSDPDGTIELQEWDLDGDGQYDDATGSVAQRMFLLPGNHTVGLRVTDDNGAPAETTKVISIGNQSPSASFNSSPGSPLTDQTINLTSTSSDSDGTIAGYAWDLDNDGQFDDGTGSTASTSFDDNGTYTIKLEVTDDNGATDVATGTVTVLNRAPSASFTASTSSPTTGQTITFNSTSTDPDGTVASYAWDTNDDGQYDDGTGSSIQAAFSGAGSHTVRLRITDDDGAPATAQLVVDVGNRPPSAGFNFAPSAPATGDQVTFTSTSSDPDGPLAAQEWDLDNDGQFDDATGATAQKSFSDNGTYTVKLRVTDSDGDSAVSSHDVTVTNRKPSAFFDYTPTSPQTSEMVTFTSHSTDSDGTVAALDWDLNNDGSYDDAHGVNAQRSFATSGSYPINLRVTDDDGAESIYSSSVTVDNRAPVAAFTFLPVAPLTGEQVTFTSASTDPDGSVQAYAWDLDNDGQFDDGTGSSAQRAFANNGTFTVRLRVTDNGGATDITSSTVTVANRPPTAAFTSAPPNPRTGQTITFTSTSSDPDGTIATYAWDLNNDGSFDDGDASTAQKSFATDGTYTIKLKVTDSDGASDTISHTVTVLNRAPVAGFDFTPASPQTGQEVTLTSASTDPDGTVASQAWDLDNDGAFDDGTAATAHHTFSVAGNYTVRLQATDDKGATNIATKVVAVANRVPVAAFGHSPASPLTNEPVTFTSSSADPDGFITAYAWDTDNDGQFDNGTNATVQKSFPTSGTFTVKLLVTDNSGDSTTATDTVTIGNRAPTAQIGFTPSTPITNQTVDFSSTSTDSDGTIAAYAWDLDNDGAFDDGTNSTAARSFPSTGPYTVKLRVTDDDGASAIGSVVITPGNQQPVAGFDFAPASPSTGATVTFTSSSTDPDGTINSYAWDTDNDGQFDDGANATAQKIFTTPGVHTVSLRVTDNDGATNTISKNVTAANRAPVSDFGFAPATPVTGQPIDFTSTSTDPDGTIAAYAWDLNNDGAFNDGSGPTAQKSFSDNGPHIIQLRVTDNSGAATVMSKTVTVANRPPIAFFQSSPDAPSTGQPVTFTSTSTDPDGTIAANAWDLDNDGQYDDGTNATATKTFTAGGTYIVRLRVTDNDGAQNFYQQSVSVANRAPTVDITATPSSVPTGQAIVLTANATDSDGTIASYAWDTDGDGNFNDGNTATVQPTYAANGPVTVAVRVTDNSGAATTATKSITVLNRAPTANFGQSPAAPLTQETITFTSTSTDPDGTIAAYAWDLDNDGLFDDAGGSSAQGAFAVNGTYTVKLRVTDDDGGTSEISKVVTVTNRPPAASFSYSPLTVNPFDTVTFTSTSTDADGFINAYAWDLDGDGQFDDATGPVVERRNAFRTVGAHTVRLRATDNSGDQNVATVEVFVGNRPPVSSFVYTPHNPLVNQTVNFFSTATDPDSTIQAGGLEWDLNGDGVFNDATGGSVSRTFPSPGAYSVGLRVTDPDGASSIYTDTVNVSVPPPPAVVQDPGIDLISPFPVVRVAGRVYSGGTRLRMLSVNAPAGTTVTVRCSGKGCPFTSSRQSAASGSRPASTIRIKRLEKRLLRSGVMVKIFITKPGAVGKFTSIKIRGRKSPLRVDRCLNPGVLKPVQCPS